MTARPLVPATYRFVLKSKARIISTVLQYHCSLDSSKWSDCSLEFE